MRLVHLYTGLFLIPWMLVYAASAFFLNHNEWATRLLKVSPPEWRLIKEERFVPDRDFPHDPRLQGQILLELMGVEGPFRVEGKPTPQELRVLRISGSGHSRVIWRRDLQQVRLEKQAPASLYRFIHFMHFRHGYGMVHAPFLVWAVIVDLASASMVFWVISGIYLWARQPRQRYLGLAILIIGLGLFSWLAWRLYQ